MIVCRRTSTLAQDYTMKTLRPDKERQSMARLCSVQSVAFPTEVSVQLYSKSQSVSVVFPMEVSVQLYSKSVVFPTEVSVQLYSKSQSVSSVVFPTEKMFLLQHQEDNNLIVVLVRLVPPVVAAPALAAAPAVVDDRKVDVDASSFVF